MSDDVGHANCQCRVELRKPPSVDARFRTLRTRPFSEAKARLVDSNGPTMPELVEAILAEYCRRCCLEAINICINGATAQGWFALSTKRPRGRPKKQTPAASPKVEAEGKDPWLRLTPAITSDPAYEWTQACANWALHAAMELSLELGLGCDAPPQVWSEFRILLAETVPERIANLPPAEVERRLLEDRRRVFLNTYLEMACSNRTKLAYKMRRAESQLRRYQSGAPVGFELRELITTSLKALIQSNNNLKSSPDVPLAP